MKIAYRRMSGPIGVTDEETGTRGLWFEKRKALVGELCRRGHMVDYCNRFTKASVAEGEVPCALSSLHDMLFVEFGSSNTSFYGQDLAVTQEMVERFKGKIVFLCDDPDLSYLWKTVPRAKQWVVWMNAIRPQPLSGQPAQVPSFDFPFSSLLVPLTPLDVEAQKFVYIGRPVGRSAAFKKLFAAKALVEIYGRAAEWSAFDVEVKDSPTQAQRRDFYAKQLGCLAIADAKHKRLGWRTGRAYHALYAGCPAIVEADNVALTAFHKFNDAQELAVWARSWSDSATRRAAWATQMNDAANDRAIAEGTFKAHGL